MGLLHIASSPLDFSVVSAITMLLSRWFQSMAGLMNKEFLYCSVLECSTTTACVLFLTCEFIMFVVSQSWNVLALMCGFGFLLTYIFMRRNRWYLPLNHFVKEYQSLVLSPGL